MAWAPCRLKLLLVNTLRPRQNGRHFPDDIFKRIFLNENVWISIKISLKFVPKGPINNIPAWVQIMAWRRSGDKPSSEPMMVSLLTYICVTRPQWVKQHDRANNKEDIPHYWSSALCGGGVGWVEFLVTRDSSRRARNAENIPMSWRWYSLHCPVNSLRPSDAYMLQ